MKRVLYIQPVNQNESKFIAHLEGIDYFSFPEVGYAANEYAEFNIDFFISDKVIPTLIEKQFDAIFIPVSLTANYLELTGLRLAYHIRLTAKLENKRYIPIIFVADETLFELLRLSALSNIIATHGCYLAKPEIDFFNRIYKRLNEDKLPGINTSNFFEHFVKRVDVAAPANYQTHHSISNEWSILRWSQVLGIQENETSLAIVKKNIESLLYYKYLQAKFPVSSIVDSAKFLIKGSGKLLYIDDEWEKGWSTVLDFFVSLSPDLKNRFTTLENHFKELSKDEVIIECEKAVKTENPDVVILDLRLSDQDFTYPHTEGDFSGIEVLKRIKAYNPGIRVIIFTASNKVWNLLELQKAGANGFVLKESPDVSINVDYAKENIIALKNQIEDALEHKYLINLWSDIEEIKAHLKPLSTGGKRSISKDFYDAIVSYLENIFGVLDANNNSTKYESAFLFAFLILEASASEFIDEDKPIDKNDGDPHGDFVFQFRRTLDFLQVFDEGRSTRLNIELRSKTRRINYNQKFLNLIYYFTGDINRTFHLVNKRNKYFHPDLIAHRTTEKIEKKDLLQLMKVVKDLLLAIN
ncbi:MAG TPA: response regulator [Pedobacter sp.]|jgi:CheY-like chemotaxis protein